MIQQICDKILLVDKPVGRTSFEVIAGIRRRLRIKKIGHSGTLDKFASGLLVVGTGRATKLTRYYLDQPKEYEVLISLGITTDTGDRDGAVTGNSPVLQKHYEMIQSVPDRFTGTIQQTPPVYSAVKIEGKRASDRIRAGEHVELQPREVHVYSIEVLKVDTDSAQLSIRVSCSKGTYVRSLAQDIGIMLGCGASLHDLRRIRSGSFRIEDAVSPEMLNPDELDGKGLLRMDEALPFMNRIVVTAEAEGRVFNGVRFTESDISEYERKNSPYSAVFNKEKKLIAIAAVDFNNWQMKYCNVFN